MRRRRTSTPTSDWPLSTCSRSRRNSSCPPSWTMGNGRFSTSASLQPKVRSAPGFQLSTRPSGSRETTATGAASTTACSLAVAPSSSSCARFATLMSSIAPW